MGLLFVPPQGHAAVCELLLGRCPDAALLVRNRDGLTFTELAPGQLCSLLPLSPRCACLLRWHTAQCSRE